MMINIDGKNAQLHPTKIVCVAKNYLAHAREMNSEIPQSPCFFLKPLSSLIADGEDIVLPKLSQRVEHEVELAVVIGRKIKNISKEDALSCVLGYSIILDITARDIQLRAKNMGMPWAEAKGYDSFAPFGPCLVSAREFDPSAVDISLKVNGKIKQNGNTRDMVFKIPELISKVSQIMTLEEHDIIATGTPVGVGVINSGDILEAEIQGIGVLTNPVK